MLQCQKGTTIIDYREINENMFFIYQGSVEMRYCNPHKSESELPFLTLFEGSSFNVGGCLGKYESIFKFTASENSTSPNQNLIIFSLNQSDIE